MMCNKKLHNLTLQKKEEILSIIKTYLQSYSSILFAFVHGSFLEEQISFRDIDIAVFFEENVQLQNKVIDFCLELSAQLSSLIHVTVDVHALNDSGIGFRYEVTRGELLLTRDEELSFEFMEKSRLMYFDLKPLLEENLNDLLKI